MSLQKEVLDIKAIKLENKEIPLELVSDSLTLIHDIAKVIEDNSSSSNNRIVKFVKKLMTHIQVINQIIKLVAAFTNKHKVINK